MFRLLEEPGIDIQGFAGGLPDVPRRTLQRDLQQAVAKRVLLATGATSMKRYWLNPKEL